MLFTPPPPPPVSFSREIAPILAMHCNSCHGEGGGLSTRSHAELMRGGNLGKAVIPGDPGASLLMDFLEGRRGPGQQMPKDGHPLSPRQLEVIRRWIAEGAQDDKLPVKRYLVTRSSVPVEFAKITRVFCRVNMPAYLVVTVRAPRDGRVLWSDVASVKSPKEGADAGEPGQMISWDLRAGNDWPRNVNLELSIEHTASEPRQVEFYARLLER